MITTLLLATYVLYVLCSYKHKGPLDRWYLCPRTPWGRVFLHRMLLPDDRPEVHNHPWPCFSIVLWGGYREMRWAKTYGSTLHMRAHSRFNINRLPLTAYHRIISVKPHTWTLFFHGRNAGRSWGFITARGYVRWDLMPERRARGRKHVG